ncbi:MAG: hypothetical protein NTY76_02550 [Candidatus Omnitrophica bacterium]|nr:hypothetical protein [Candidatus Omnitrophota bacterium]
MKRQKNVIWIQRLGSPQIVSMLFRRIAGSSEIFYDEHCVTPTAKLIMKAIAAVGAGSLLRPAELSISQRDGEGFAASQGIWERMDKSIDRFCDDCCAGADGRSRKTIKSYLAAIVRSQCEFIGMVELKIDGAVDCDNILYITRHPANRALDGFYDRRNYCIKEYGLKDTIKHYLKPLYYAFLALLVRFIPQRGLGNACQTKPSVWVEYVKTDVFDFAFWRRHIVAETFDIINYIDRDDRGHFKETVDDITDRAFKWLRLDIVALMKLARLKPSDLAPIFFKRRLRSSNEPRWFAIYTFEYEILYILYRAVFVRFKARMLIQHQETSWRQDVQSRAIEDAGGIMFGYNWSNYYFYPLPTHIFPQHVYFVWGDNIKESMMKLGNMSMNILPSGLWLTPGKETPAGLQKMAGGLDFIMAIFDNSAGYKVLHSPGSLARFYLEMLELLEQNPRWGGIIKSKSYDIAALRQLPRGEEIVSKVESLGKEGRLAVIDHGQSPLAVSREADLAVCYGLNSAGIVAAVYGTPAVHWDCGGVGRFAFYEDVQQRFFFKTLDEMKEAIRLSAAGDTSIGDFSNWAREFNYFNDLAAPARVGRFIMTFMDRLSATDEIRPSLKYSVERYMEENGLSSGVRGGSFEKACA